MSRIVITTYKGQLLTAVFDEERCVRLIPQEKDALPVGTVRLGRVISRLKNIQAVFVELMPGVNGYYSLEAGGNLPLKPGQEVPVQVERAAVGTKLPVLTSNLTFSGIYAVLTTTKDQIGISTRIADESWRTAARQAVADLRDKMAQEGQWAGWGLILRTAAYEADPAAVEKEIRELAEQARRVMEQARSSTCHSLLYDPDPVWLQAVRDQGQALDEVVTDLPEVAGQLRRWLDGPGDTAQITPAVTLYQDPSVSLAKVTRLEHCIHEALSRRVWLKSGAYLVIDRTEALTAVDVNTGKCTDRRNMRETILRVNREAAKETAAQLQLRNISGMILVDLINMTEEDDRKTILDYFASELKKDPVPCRLVDMTALGLVEITRKKVQKPLAEVLKTAENRENPVDKD